MATRRRNHGMGMPSLGAFVIASHNGFGIGKLAAIDGDWGTVEYFDVPVTGGLVTERERLMGLQAVVLERQHCVWWNDGAGWHVGRVDRPPLDADENYLVAFPDQRLLELPERELYVRWSRPLTDPLRLLAARTVETRYFHIHRSRFLSTLLEQRAACDDLGGILSSSVELHLHQVAAARRVLADPIQRYLLADEVGLGKTIEAGMVIRQLLIDEDAPRVMVLVPDSITTQWEDELETKFRVSWFEGRVDVLPHRWLADQEQPVDADLLVVDEVHRLTGTDANSAVYYEHLRQMACETPRLLLLSATPVRSNEDAFLKMLHLLDPLLYRLDDLEGFRDRVARRDDVALAVTSLAENTPLFLLPKAIDRLRDTFPDDQVLGIHLDALAAAVAAKDKAAGDLARRATKSHVSETYRLHRRLIRTRRNERLQETFPVRLRRRAEPWTIADPDPGRNAVLQALDAFRVAIAGESTVDPVEVLRLVAGRLGAGRPAIEALNNAMSGGRKHDLNPADSALAVKVRRLDAGRALQADLTAVLATTPEADRLTSMVEWTWKHVGKAKLAACSEFTSVARAARDRMEERYGIRRVAALLSDMTSAELAEELERARDDELCILLVCDGVAEEGWNLQFIDSVLHLDLPWSVNRLEQRLGRFDRFAGQSAQAVRNPIQSLTISDTGIGDRLTGAWRRVLDEGFGVFERSTASLQYVLPEHEERLLDMALFRGFNTMTEGLDRLREDLDLIRRRIDGQDLFDSVDDVEADETYVAALELIDDEAGVVRGAFNGWLSGALRFSPFSRDGGVGYGIKVQQPPLLPETALYSLGLHHLRHIYVDSRHQAIRRPANGFLRWGEPLVDRLLRQAELDDRGHAFAVRRRHPAIPGGTPFWPVFRFDVMISPCLEALDALGAEGTPERRAIERRLRRYLAPWIEGVLLGPRMEELPAGVAALVEDPRDLDDNLGKRPQEFDELVAGLDWRQLCCDSAAAALGIVARRERTMVRIADAQAKFRSDATTHRAQEAARQAYLGRVAGAGAPEAIDEALARALATPAYRVESCGVVFLGPRE